MKSSPGDLDRQTSKVRSAPRQTELSGREGTNDIMAAQRETLQEIGRFRTIAVDDLAQFHDRGNPAQLRQDLRSLVAAGLAQRRTVSPGAGRDPLTVVVLTRRGKALLEQTGTPPSGQRFYAGFVKPAEVAHDAAIYRMYHAESERIRAAGGRIRRVVLDYELKQNVYSPLAKARHLPPLEYARRQTQVAQETGLKVVRGRIPLPDLRIEYQTREGEETRVDLELATEHYRGSQVRTKAEAGFTMYAPNGSVSRLSAALEDPELVGSILSL
jgi:hypothetical protein